jgi:hypothetical protein
LSCGIYFHGKDLFRSFMALRREIDGVIGGPTDWTEYDKDASIVLSRDFDLADASSYADAYAWLAKYAILFRKAYERAQGLLASGTAELPADAENNEEEASASDSAVKGGNRPAFRFTMVGIRPGEELTFNPTGITVKVASDNQIEYEGRIYKLSPFVGTFMPEDRRMPSGSYQGPKYFSYKGKVLTDLRDEIESQ